MAHDGNKDRRIQRQQPAVLSVRLCPVGGTGFGTVGQAIQLRLIANVFGPGLGGIQGIVGKLAGQLRQSLGVGHVLRFLVIWQIYPGEAEITQGIFNVFLLGFAERAPFITVTQRLVGGTQLCVLAHFGAVLTEQRQAAVVGITQGFILGHRIEMPGRAEGLAQAVVFLIQCLHQMGVIELALRQHLLDARAAIRHQLLHGGQYVFWLDFGKRRQFRIINQRVVTHGCPVLVLSALLASADE